MQISEAWLREHTNPDISTHDLAESLSLAGLEVDGIEPVAGEFTGVVVGEVLTIHKHPDADKLNVTTVDVGDSEPLTIVCGANNVRVGMKTACAKVGAVLPGNFKIKAAKLRGQPSHGMLSSASELGMAEDSDGILELPIDATTGQDLRAYLQLDDHTLDVDLTPNRSDCLSILGMAREVATMTGSPFIPMTYRPWTATELATPTVTIDAKDACHCYSGCVVENFDTRVKTPIWMKEKLRRCGQRSINLLVDITNFVLIETGQPMHGFDLDKLTGNIRVRMAKMDEPLVLLDGQSITLKDNALVIADDSGAIALAGIMGGLSTSVDEQTSRVFFEAAHFVPEAIKGKARGYGLHTDSSHRFERGVDPLLPQKALQRAVELLTSIAGGDVSDVVLATGAVTQDQLGVTSAITFRRHQIERVLGTPVSDKQVQAYLSGLGCQLTNTDDGWSVVPPSYRFDLQIEVDLIEELGRLVGYDHLPPSTVGSPMTLTTHTETQRPEAALKHQLTQRGYFEAITYSFVKESDQLIITPDEGGIALANPLSDALKMMRTNLWVGLLKTLDSNLKRQQHNMRLFETGLVFHAMANDDIAQLPSIGGVITGQRLQPHWRGATEKVDFYDIKGDVEALLNQSFEPSHIRFVPSKHPALHPGQSADVMVAGEKLGQFGLLHPVAQKQLDIQQPVYVFELLLQPLLNQHVPHYTPVSKFPAVNRDLALVMPQDLSLAVVTDTLYGLNLQWLDDIHVFDVYQGDGVAEGYKSVAMSFTLQKTDATLIDEEVDQIMDTIVNTLAQAHPIVLR